MKQLILAVVVAVMVMPAVALAQGSGSTKPAGPKAERGHSVTRSIVARVADVDRQLGLLVVEDSGGNRHEFTVDANTRYRADRGTTLAGRTDLGLADFSSGQTVKVLFRASTGVAVEVRLRQPAN